MQRLLMLAVSLLLAGPSVAGAATAAGGRADFTIASKTSKALKRGKVKMTAIGGSYSKTKAVLPVVSGTDNGALLGGGIKFKKGKKVLSLSNLTLDRTQGIVYATVSKTVVPFFLLDSTKATDKPDGTDTLSGPFRVKLSAIGSSVFAARTGSKIGMGSSFATLKLTLQSASTRLLLDPSFSTALTGAGLKVSPASEAIEGSAGLYLPVTTAKGKVSLTAPITHNAGFTIVSASMTLLTLDKLTIDPVAGTVTAEGPSGALPILTIDKTKAKSAKRGKQLVVTGLKLALTAEAANAINTTFGVTTFAAGAVVGTAVIVGTR